MPYEQTHRVNENEILEKLCNKCNQWFPCTNEYFYKTNSKSKDGLFPYCKKCNIKKSSKRNKENHEEYLSIQKEYRESHCERMAYLKKRWRTNNKEHVTEYQQGWQQKYPDKCKAYNENRYHKNHKITTVQWNNCKKYFIHKCAYCGLKLEDHYIPRKGEMIWSDFHKEHVDHFGNDGLDNCVPSCKSCNSLKWKFGLEVWYTEDNPVFSKERLDRIIKWITEDYKTL